jgi:hypothetical protein
LDFHKVLAVLKFSKTTFRGFFKADIPSPSSGDLIFQR